MLFCSPITARQSPLLKSPTSPQNSPTSDKRAVNLCQKILHFRKRALHFRKSGLPLKIPPHTVVVLAYESVADRERFEIVLRKCLSLFVGG